MTRTRKTSRETLQQRFIDTWPTFKKEMDEVSCSDPDCNCKNRKMAMVNVLFIAEVVDFGMFLQRKVDEGRPLNEDELMHLAKTFSDIHYWYINFADEQLFGCETKTGEGRMTQEEIDAMELESAEGAVDQVGSEYYSRR